MRPENELTIGALSKATGCKVETIRYYERIGLLPAPDRTAGNYRRYGPEHRQRLSFIRRSRELGFPLGSIRELLRLADEKDRDCGEVDRIAQNHLHEVERKIDALRMLAEELRHVSTQCQGGTVSECRIIEALSPG